jgi:hypothetical protein
MSKLPCVAYYVVVKSSLEMNTVADLLNTEVFGRAEGMPPSPTPWQAFCVTHGVQKGGGVDAGKFFVAQSELDKCASLMKEHGVLKPRFVRGVTAVAPETPTFVVVVTNDDVFALCKPKLSREAFLAQGMRNAGLVAKARKNKGDSTMAFSGLFQACASVSALKSVANRLVGVSGSE